MTIECEACRRPFSGRRDARYCSGACRTAAHRSRNGARTVRRDRGAARIGHHGISSGDVLAVDPVASRNGQRVADLARLGYLAEPVVDPTYGVGGMWSRWRPERLVAFDLDPRAEGVAVADLGALPLPDGSVGSVLLDPPYKVGPSFGDDMAGKGDAANRRFGLPDELTLDDVLALYRAGIGEAARVVRRGGYVIVKAQDCHVGKRYVWMTREVGEMMEARGLRVVDQLHLVGYVPQPPGKRQRRARRNVSTFVVART